jgi:tRNA-dihydrouridine synthase
MIGRAAVGRPWIFRDIRHYLDTGEILPEPNVGEKVNIALQHLELSLEHKEGRRAILELRRHLSNYFKGLPDFRDTRLRLLTSNEPEEIRSLLNFIADRWGTIRSEDRSGIY